MAEMPPPVSLDRLLAHRAWVRRVARALVADASRADDLEQEVWRRAMARPPRDRGSIRGWLAVVLRRAAVDQRRAEARRARHEGAAPPSGEAPDVADLVAEAESHRRVVTAVMALEEPYRSTVLLRWFEDLAPSEVARRLGVPVETVRTRLKRALPILRARLDAEHGGDGRSWVLALAPLAGGPVAAPAPPVPSPVEWGAWIVGTKTKVAVAAAVVAVLGLGWWSLSDPGRGTGPLPGPSGADTATVAGDPRIPVRAPGPAVSPGSRGEAIPVDAPVDPGPSESPATAAKAGVRFGIAAGAPEADAVSGRVVDPGGRPLPDAVVQVVSLTEPPKPGAVLPDPAREARTDGEGRFRFEDLGPGDRYMEVRVSAPGRRPEAAWIGPGTHGMEVTLARSYRVAGIVVDRATGLGIPGVLLLARPVGSGPAGPAFPARTGADGRFDFGDALAEGEWTLEVNAPGGGGPEAAAFVPLRMEPIGKGGGNLRIELDRGLALGGVLLDAAGAPVATAFTAEVLGRTEHGNPDYSRRRYRSVENPDGAFRFDGLPPGSYDLMLKPAAGPEDAHSDLVAATVVRGVLAGTEDLRVTLVAGAPISGRLVDESGDPVTARGYLYIYPEGSQAGAEDCVTLGADGTGRFETVPLDPGRRYDLLATGFPGHMAGRAEGLWPGDPPVTVTLRRGGSLAGRVVDGEGNPVGAGVPVSARAEGAVDPKKEGTGMVAYTQAGGTFRVDGLGDYSFTVVAGGGETAWAAGEPRRAVRVGTVDLVLGVRRGVTMTGRLVDSDGRPFRTHYLAAFPAGAIGSVGSWTRVEDAEGSFTLRGVAHGQVSLSCYRGETFVNLGTFEAPAEGLVVTVPGE